MGGNIPIRVDKPSQTPGTAQPSTTAAFLSALVMRTSPARLLQLASNLRNLSAAERIAFLKRTGRLWFTAAGVIFGVIILITLTDRVIEWARNARERRHETAVASVTPDRLIARCGTASLDTTKQVFPILMRTISYTTTSNRTVVLTFSRTAEEKSDWVFLSMNDAKASVTYDTPDAKIAALPCLDSTK